MAKHLKAVERRIVEAIKSRYAQPDLEIPMSLQDRPTQVVFTGLQPRKRPGADGQVSHVTPLMGALGSGAEALPELLPGSGEAPGAAGPQAAAQGPQQGVMGGEAAAGEAGLEEMMAALMGGGG